ncbi:MAG: hypothetical protein IJ728_00740 [Selenomonadaceae bacterium]|nr:hypothetical protein [Selenomonadaceae bacterium]
MHIEIGTAKTLNCQNWKENKNRRLTKIETIGGNIVQDFGQCKGDKTFTCTCQLDNENNEIVTNYFDNQEKIKIVDQAGKIYFNMRINIISDKYIEMFETKKYHELELEFWEV